MSIYAGFGRTSIHPAYTFAQPTPETLVMSTLGHFPTRSQAPTKPQLPSPSTQNPHAFVTVSQDFQLISSTMSSPLNRNHRSSLLQRPRKIELVTKTLL